MICLTLKYKLQYILIIYIRREISNGQIFNVTPMQIC